MHTLIELKLGTHKILVKANFGTIFDENLIKIYGGMTDCSYKMRLICGKSLQGMS